MVFREGRTKAVGTVVEVSPQEPTQAKTKQKERVHKQRMLSFYSTFH